MTEARYLDVGQFGDDTPDWGDIVDDIVIQLEDRKSMSFVDEGLETWEVKRIWNDEEGYPEILAVCPARQAILRIKDT
tara:strand:- start:1009 stop:1242 length:234 start_codon:yes stop_codon:yes gene_type:complete